MVSEHVLAAALHPTPWVSVPDVDEVPCVQLYAFAGHACCVQARVQDFVHADAAVEPAGAVYPELHAVQVLPFL